MRSTGNTKWSLVGEDLAVLCFTQARGLHQNSEIETTIRYLFQSRNKYFVKPRKYLKTIYEMRRQF